MKSSRSECSWRAARPWSPVRQRRKLERSGVPGCNCRSKASSTLATIWSRRSKTKAFWWKICRNNQHSPADRPAAAQHLLIDTMPSFIRFLSLSLFSVVLSLSFSNQTGAAEQPQGRYFLMGSGTMHLKNLRNNREAKVNLLNPDKSFNEEAFNKVDWVFDFPTEEKGEHISPRLLFMLSYFADRLAPKKTINIESAYRSPEYNNKIREQGNNAAQTSTHQDGLALDFWLQGVSGKQIWKTIRAKNCCGIGH